MESLLEQASMDPDAELTLDSTQDEALTDSPSDTPGPGSSGVNVNDFGTIFSASAPFMDVSITRFYPTSNRMIYEVTTWEDGSGKNHVVERSYDDFEWLYDQLVAEDQLSGCAIQPLPAAVFWYPEDEQQLTMLSQTMQQQGIGVHVIAQDPLQKRAAQLERWLRRLTGLAELRQDLHLRTFCLFQDKIDGQPKGLWHDFSSLFGGVRGELTTEQAQFKTRCKQVLAPTITELCQRLSRRTRAVNELALCHYETALALNLFTSSSEPQQQYQNGVADGLRRSAYIQVQNSASMDTALEVLLSEQLGALRALVASYERTSSLKEKYRRAEADLAKQPAAQKEQQQAKVDRISTLVDSVESSLEHSEKSIRMGRLTEFKQCMTVYAVTQMELAVAELQLWSQVKSDLLAIAPESGPRLEDFDLTLDDNADNDDSDDNHDNDDNDDPSQKDTEPASTPEPNPEPTEGAAPGTPFRGGEVLAF
eukprot:m.172481 g.172481  ORF g.172481 m.172481 type:complete len:479 (+) comp16717_c0_seq2:111-1547(+)